MNASQHSFSLEVSTKVLVNGDEEVKREVDRKIKRKVDLFAAALIEKSGGELV
jgi:hypothetical protein